MNIRDAKLSDRDVICLLADQVNRDHHHNMPDDFLAPGDVEANWEHWLSFIDGDETFLLVAEMRGAVAGFIACRIIQSGKAPFLVEKTKLQVSTIVVSSEVQREGVGRQLMLSAIDKGKSMGARETTLEVMMYNKDAQLFYETLGFTEFSRKLSLV